MRYFIGVDLGQSNDYTAISVIRAEGQAGEIIHLERLRLGTPYPDQVITIKALHDHIRQFRTPISLIVDYTGVGRPVVDLIRQSGLLPIALSITGGNEAKKDGYEWSIPKRDLVGALIAAFQSNKLKIARSLPDADNLMKELMNFKLKINAKTGHDSYAAQRESVHDDLVLSVAMAAYTANLGKVQQ